MATESSTPQTQYWEETSLPKIFDETTPLLVNPWVMVDEYGRVVSITSGTKNVIQIQSDGSPIGQFSSVNFVGDVITTTTTNGVLNISFDGITYEAEIPVWADGDDAIGDFNQFNFSGNGFSVVENTDDSTIIDVSLVGVTLTLTQAVSYSDLAEGTNPFESNLLPLGSVIRAINWAITTAYTGATSLSLTNGDGTELMSTAEINPAETATYRHEFAENIAGITTANERLMVPTFVGTPTAGVGYISIEYYIAS